MPRGGRVGDGGDVVGVDGRGGQDEVGEIIAARYAGVGDVDEPAVVQVGVVAPAGGDGRRAVGDGARGGLVGLERR